MKKPDKVEVEFFTEIQSLIGHTRFTESTTQTLRRFDRICGVDAAYSARGNSVVAAATLFVEGKLSETSIYSGAFTFPYVSGLFYLHEGPFVVAAVRRLKEVPQLVCFDAHGAAHPNSGGLATICGQVLGIPSIGIAKSPLVGKEVAYRSGLTKIGFENKIVGYVTSKPKRYWSPGYAVSVSELETIICSKNGEICLKAIKCADISAKREIRSLSTG